jgi:uncharacterized membrane protein YphA (DoxX/SURF4 family)
VLALLLGGYLVFNGLQKIAWFTDSSILAERLNAWLQNAAPGTRWYIDTIARPGVPMFARLVPLVELSTGAAIMLGFWTRLAAALGLVLVVNLHLARGFFYEWAFLADGTGLPVLGGLLALTLGGARLPFSVSK